MNTPPVSPLIKERYRLALLAVSIIYVTLQAILSRLLLLTHDEGINLQVEALIQQGYEPYTQIFTLSHPLFIGLLTWLGRFNLSVHQNQALFLVFGLITMLNVASLTRLLLGNRAAIAAAFFFATTTTALAEATNLYAIIPALSVATLSCVTILRYSLTAKWAWLVLSSLLWIMGLFISTHVLPIGLMHLIFLLFLRPDQTSRLTKRTQKPEVARPLMIWLMISIGGFGLGMLFSMSNFALSHLLSGQITIWTTLPLRQVENFLLIGQFLTFNLPLCLLVVYSISCLYEESDHLLWLVVIWGLIGFCWLMLQKTLRFQDLAILLPPLSMLAGWGIIHLINRFITSSQFWSVSLSICYSRWAGLAIVGLFVYSWISWQQLNRYQLQTIKSEGDFIQVQERPEVINFIRDHTVAEACVIIDDTTLAVAADRLPPPFLVNLAPWRFDSGLLTETDLIVEAEKANCTMALFSKRQYYLHLPTFRDWAKEHYKNTHKFSKTRIHY